MTDAPHFDLNAWHRGVHQVTGGMALKFNKATLADLQRWAAQLRTIADQMAQAAPSAGAAVARNENGHSSAPDPFGASPPWLIP